jgi:uncharacterized membrane protein YphA (DoxX/SURF4 family)
MHPRWQSIVEWTAAVLLAAMWFVAGLWKLSDVTGTQVRLTQALVPHALSLPGALGLGAVETFAGILLLTPAWRRWGAWLSGALLVFFLAYVGYHYRALTGAECSCFPWLKRAIGPMFFVQDGALLLLAFLAGRWSQPPRRPRPALAALAGVAVLALGSFSIDRTKAAGAVGPEFVTVDGKRFPLRQGRVFVYFFNPLCRHCFQAAQAMSKLSWQAELVAVPTQDPDLGSGFLADTGLKARLSLDTQPLRDAFPFQDVPYGVALEKGLVREKLAFFEEPEFSAKLRGLGFVQ